MAMNWSDERYVRIYTRDTNDWLCLSFLAQGLFCLLLRKVDRAGVLDLGKTGRKGVFLAIGHVHQSSMLEPALEELEKDGCVEVRGDQLIIPNFMDAQEAESSDKARAKKYREKRRAKARGGVTGNDTDETPVTPASPDVTGAKEAIVTLEAGPVTIPSRPVTPVTICDANVTPSRAVPSVPSEPAAERPRRLEVVDEGGGAPTPYLWPRAASFRQALTDRMARTVLFPIGGQEPKVMSSLEASLVAIPEAEAVELCRERILAAHSANRRGGGTLSYFAQVLADEAARRQTNAKTAPKRKRVVGVDALGQPIFEVQA